MKYKGIELEGLDKKVKLSHSRVMETDEGTDWIDKLLTCDKAALTRKHKLGMDTAVCRAESKEAAVAQLLPEMRDCVEYVSQRWAMRDCYPNPKGILRDEVI